MQLGLTIFTLICAVLYLVVRFNPFTKNKKQAGCEKCGQLKQEP